MNDIPELPKPEDDKMVVVPLQIMNEMLHIVTNLKYNEVADCMHRFNVYAKVLEPGATDDSNAHHVNEGMPDA